MKEFKISMLISANDALTEAILLERFDEFLKHVPRNADDKLFKNDCCLIGTSVDEISENIQKKNFRLTIISRYHYSNLWDKHSEIDFDTEEEAQDYFDQHYNLPYGASDTHYRRKITPL